MFWFLILPLCCSTSTPHIQDIMVEPASDEIRANFVPNFSFEDVKDGVPVGWRWDQRNTDAYLTADSENSHTGKRSVKIQNNNPYCAQVYGSLYPLTCQQNYTNPFNDDYKQVSRTCFQLAPAKCQQNGQDACSNDKQGLLHHRNLVLQTSLLVIKNVDGIYLNLLRKTGGLEKHAR